MYSSIDCNYLILSIKYNQLRIVLYYYTYIVVTVIPLNVVEWDLDTYYITMVKYYTCILFFSPTCTISCVENRRAGDADKIFSAYATYETGGSEWKPPKTGTVCV